MPGVWRGENDAGAGAVRAAWLPPCGRPARGPVGTGQGGWGAQGPAAASPGGEPRKAPDVPAATGKEEWGAGQAECVP